MSIEDNWFDSKLCRYCNSRYVNMHFSGNTPICDVCQERQEESNKKDLIKNVINVGWVKLKCQEL